MCFHVTTQCFDTYCKNYVYYFTSRCLNTVMLLQILSKFVTQHVADYVTKVDALSLHHVRHFSKLIIYCHFCLRCIHCFIIGCIMSNSCHKIGLFYVYRPKCSVTKLYPLSSHVTKLDPLSSHVTKLQVLSLHVCFWLFLTFSSYVLSIYSSFYVY